MSVSYIVLWLLVLSLTVFAIVLSKKPKRVLPANHTGLPVGTAFPKLQIRSVLKQIPFHVVYPEPKQTLLLFSSSHCSMCNAVYPLLPVAEQKYKLMAQVIMEPLEEGHVESMIRKIDDFGLTAPVFELTMSIREEVKLEGYPFAYFLSSEGKVLSKGGINRLEDIDLLVSQGRRVAMRRRAG